jgi:hypothetical protein
VAMLDKPSHHHLLKEFNNSHHRKFSGIHMRRIR